MHRQIFPTYSSARRIPTKNSVLAKIKEKRALMKSANNDSQEMNWGIGRAQPVNAYNCNTVSMLPLCWYPLANQYLFSFPIVSCHHKHAVQPQLFIATNIVTGMANHCLYWYTPHCSPLTVTLVLSCRNGHPSPDRYVLICGCKPVTALSLAHSHWPLQSLRRISSFFQGWSDRYALVYY